MSRLPAVAVAAVLAVALVATTACGVPDDREPRVIGAAEAVVDLAPTTVPVETTGDDLVRVFFVDRSGEVPTLMGVDRSVSTPAPPTVLEQLLQGPKPEEELASSIPPGTTIRGTSVDETRTLTIDLAESDGGLLSVAGDVQTEAFAQIVWTMTRLTGIRAVRFLSDGEPVQVPRAGAAPTTAPVTRADYASLAPGQG